MSRRTWSQAIGTPPQAAIASQGSFRGSRDHSRTPPQLSNAVSHRGYSEAGPPPGLEAVVPMQVAESSNVVPIIATQSAPSSAIVREHQPPDSDDAPYYYFTKAQLEEV